MDRAAAREPYVKVKREVRTERSRVKRDGKPDYHRVHYYYELACGHVVRRAVPGREGCYCEQCPPLRATE